MEAGSKVAIFIDDSLVKDKKSFVQINVKKTQQILSSQIETFGVICTKPRLRKENYFLLQSVISTAQAKV